MRSSWMMVAAVLGLASGCGESGTVPATASSTGDPTAATNVVSQFLEAVRQGDTDAAAKWLTPLALKRTSEEDLDFSPPGSATASFKVADVEFIESDKAVVNSTWTDLDAAGAPHHEAIIWALRQSAGQWRISGMAAELGPNQPPMVMDFENPEAMFVEQPVAKSVGAAANATPAAAKPSGEVAGNPFQQATQR